MEWVAAVDQGSGQTLSERAWGDPEGRCQNNCLLFFLKEFIVKSLFLQYQLVQCFFYINITYRVILS